MRLFRPWQVAFIAVVALVLAGLAAPTSAEVVKNPDLTVTKGSVRITGQHADRILGRFTVKNAGSLPSTTSTAFIQAKKGKRWRKLTESRILPLAPRKTAVYAYNTPRPLFVAIGGNYPVRVCLDVKHKVRESREGNNCRALGTLRLQLVEDEVDYQPDTKFFHSYAGVAYWGWVPSGYDPDTPTTLFVWLHGCGGENRFDIDSFHASELESYVTIGPSGREQDCWKTPSDQSGGDERLVMDAANEAASHFNVDKLVLGGYSSGGDLAYRTAYLFSESVEAVLAANTSPFKDTGLTPDVLPSVTHKFRVVHLAHLGDEEYPIDTVRSELTALSNAGFSVTSVERPGNHFDGPGENGLPGTDADIQEVLLPFVILHE